MPRSREDERCQFRPLRGPGGQTRTSAPPGQSLARAPLDRRRQNWRHMQGPVG